MARRGRKRKWGPRTLVAIRLPDDLLARIQAVVESTPGASLTGAVIRALRSKLRGWESAKAPLKPDTVPREWAPDQPFRAVRRKRPK